MNNERGVSALSSVWFAAGVLVIAAAVVYLVGQYRVRASDDVQFSTPYQMVAFVNGSVYFGKLQGYGGNHPELMDVYYVVTQMDPQTKQQKSMLIKRGNEWHQPDRMYINPLQILMVEPVSPNSKVAQLIEQMHEKQ